MTSVVLFTRHAEFRDAANALDADAGGAELDDGAVIVVDGDRIDEGAAERGAALVVVDPQGELALQDRVVVVHRPRLDGLVADDVSTVAAVVVNVAVGEEEALRVVADAIGIARILVGAPVELHRQGRRGSAVLASLSAGGCIVTMTIVLRVEPTAGHVRVQTLAKRRTRVDIIGDRVEVRHDDADGTVIPAATWQTAERVTLRRAMDARDGSSRRDESLSWNSDWRIAARVLAHKPRQ